MNLNELGQLNYLKLSEVGVTDGLVGWWRLDEDVLDYSGNNNHGALINNPGYDVGKTGSSISFDNTSTQAIVIQDNEKLKLTNFSLSVWANWKTFKDYGVVVQKGNGGDVNTINYALWSYVNSITLFVGNGTTYQSIVMSKTSLNIWHNVICTGDGSNLKMYLDGILIIQASQTVIPDSSTNSPLTIGHTTYGMYGEVDEVKIYDRALSPEEVGIMYNIGSENIAMQLSSDGTLYLKGQIKEV